VNDAGREDAMNANPTSTPTPTSTSAPAPTLALALALAAAAALLAPALARADGDGSDGAWAAARHSIDFSPVSPLFDIWGVQYGFRITAEDELVLGLAYMNIRYDVGRSHAPTATVGYRRTLWRNLHLEYLLMPSYDWFWSSVEGRTYRSVELWNEARVGYRLDFVAGGLPLYVDVEWLLGFGLYGGNKPESFRALVREEPVFTAPMLFTGVRF
jgi:hypothetical protein